MSVGLHHVQIAMPAGGEDAASQFYGNMLGLVQISKPANLAPRGGVWFATATLPVHIGVDAQFVSATKAHLAFEVSRFDELRSRLLGAGIAIVEDEPLEGYDRFYVTDPFGNRVECLSRRTVNEREEKSVSLD